jgi:hypothetical protein
METVKRMWSMPTHVVVMACQITRVWLAKHVEWQNSDGQAQTMLFSTVSNDYVVDALCLIITHPMMNIM